MKRLYHGGVSGLHVGDAIVPSPPHEDDACIICTARAAGRVITVGQYRAWLMLQGPQAVPALRLLDGAPSNAPVDPPRTKSQAVYVTTDIEYARWYASCRRGDLYEVRPTGEVTLSKEDHFDTYTCDTATVAAVIERGVMLRRQQRRELMRRWKKADLRADRARS